MIRSRRTFVKVSLALVATGSLLSMEGCTEDDVQKALELSQVIGAAVAVALQIALTATGNGALAGVSYSVVKEALDEATIAVTVLVGTIQQYKNTPDATTAQKIQIALQQVEQQVQKALNAGGITDADTLNTYKSGLDLILSAIGTVANLIPAANTGTMMAGYRMHLYLKHGRKHFVQDFNKALAEGGYQRYSIK